MKFESDEICFSRFAMGVNKFLWNEVSLGV